MSTKKYQLYTQFSQILTYKSQLKKKYFSSINPIFNQQVQKFSMQEPRPSDQEIAAILLANGQQPDRDEPDEKYVQRLNKWLKQNEISLTALQIDYIRKNISSIRAKIKEKLMVRNVLCGAGHVGKWAYTLAQCVSKAKGWAPLVAKTSAYAPLELAKLSFAKSIASSSMWWVTGIIAAIQVGAQFYDLCTKKISIKQFFVNTGKIILVSGATMVGGAGGAYAGAAIGMACGGPIGSIVGIIIGGISGSFAASYGTKKLLQYADEKYQYYTAQKLIQQALNFFQLPSKCSLEYLDKLKKHKFSQYHPDKWREESQQKQKEMASKMKQMMEYYQILKNGIQATFETKRQEALQFYQLPNKYSQEDLEKLKQMKITQYDPDKWANVDYFKRKLMADKRKKAIEYYEILKNGKTQSKQIRIQIEN